MVAIGSIGDETPRVRIWPPRQSHSLSRLGQLPVHIHSLLSGHTEKGSPKFPKHSLSYLGVSGGRVPGTEGLWAYP